MRTVTIFQDKSLDYIFSTIKGDDEKQGSNLSSSVHELSKFLSLAETGLKMKHDVSFQTKLSENHKDAISHIAALNCEMNLLRPKLRKAGYDIPLSNNLSADAIAAIANQKHSGYGHV